MDKLPNVIVNILRDTGYTNSVPSSEFLWIKSIEKLGPFYEWLICSVTKNNFVTKDELLCYNHIVKSGKLLSKEELDSRLSHYINPEPTVFVDEVDVDDINFVITKKKKVVEQLNLVKTRLKQELQNKELKNNDGEFVKELLNKEVRNVHVAEKKYKDQFHGLDGKIRIILENLSNLENGAPKYLCQHDLTSYQLRNINLDIYTERLKKKIFRDEKSDDSESNIMLDDRVNNVFYWLRDIEYTIGCYGAVEAAADEVIKYLCDCEANIDNMEDFFRNENKYTCSVNKVIRPNEEDLLTSFEFHLTDIVRGIQLNMSKERLSRKKDNLILLNELENIVKIRKLCNSSLYYLLINEWKTIRSSISLVKDVFSYLQNGCLEYEHRMIWMKGFKIKQDTQTLSESAANHSSLMPVNQSLSIYHNQPTNFCSSIAKYKENILKNFQNYITIHRNMYSEIMKVDRFIFNGATRNVRYCDDIVTILEQIYSLINCGSVSIDNEMDEFQKFKESLENNYDLLHMMWYEWHKNPYNVIEAILKLESSNEIRNRRLSIMIGTELSSKEFEEYKTF